MALYLAREEPGLLGDAETDGQVAGPRPQHCRVGQGDLQEVTITGEVRVPQRLGGGGGGMW